MSDIKRAAAGAGAALAVGALAKRLVRREMPAERKERLRQAYAEAGADPAYQAEMAKIDRAFDVTVGDGLDED
ncbi:MAG TPA: hypothetical protein VLK84_29045 [Longimicrobium sp.]|nr:hypothetical protein [Longimicrobium sp.]